MIGMMSSAVPHAILAPAACHSARVRHWIGVGLAPAFFVSIAQKTPPIDA
jgi:hypothetical protein